MFSDTSDCSERSDPFNLELDLRSITEKTQEELSPESLVAYAIISTVSLLSLLAKLLRRFLDVKQTFCSSVRPSVKNLKKKLFALPFVFDSL